MSLIQWLLSSRSRRGKLEERTGLKGQGYDVQVRFNEGSILDLVIFPGV